MTYACPVCGYPFLKAKPYEMWPPLEGAELSPPYRHQLGAPSYEVCALCGYEFGFDDDPGTVPVGRSFESYRARWHDRGGAPFSDGEFLPDGFDPRSVSAPDLAGSADERAIQGEWIGLARSSSLEVVRDAFLAWCASNGFDPPPTSEDEVRWHHGLGGDGEYWDVWVRSDTSDQPVQQFTGEIWVGDGPAIPFSVMARSSGEAKAKLEKQYGEGHTISLSYDPGTKRDRDR